MPQDFAYKQLLTLIAARAQQWLRNRIDLLPQEEIPDAQIDDLAEIALAARICTSLRGSDAPLQVFLRSRFGASFTDLFLNRFQNIKPGHGHRGVAFLCCLPPGHRDPIAASGHLSLPARLALSDGSDARLRSEAEAMLRRPVPDERLDDQVVETFVSVLALCYRFGAERPRFASPRTYGDAFANCLRFADWAQRNRRLLPLVQAIHGLCLIDPDHDVTPMLADVIASQRPDGSFPARIGFGTADQDDAALRPTLGALVALHMAIHSRWHAPRPTVPMAA